MSSNKIVNLVNPTNAQDAATKTYVDTSIPIGGIIMWSGTIASIPTNWRLCDGTTYGSLVTPDLRNRFIIGASLDTATTHTTGGSSGITRAHTSIETPTNYVTGGSKDAVVVSHNHGITDTGHHHTIGTGGGIVYQPPGGLRSGTFYDVEGGPEGGYFSLYSNLAFTYKSRTAYTGISIKSEGESGTNKNLPPYYALAFIMRIS
jgi:hypothetical protein